MNQWALLIGIAAYQHLPPLKKTCVDAQDLHAVLLENGYLSENTALLLDDQASKSAIHEKLNWLTESAGPEDTVVVFFSGHGARSPGGFWPGEYLCPVEANLKQHPDTAISSRELTTALKAIPAARVVVLLDACHSGGVGDTKGDKYRLNLSQAAYEDLASGKGRIIVASSRPEEPSWELPDQRNGLFTTHLLEGLRGRAAQQDGAIWMTELFGYVYRQVSRDKLQHPYQKWDGEDFVIATAKSPGSARPDLSGTHAEEVLAAVEGLPVLSEPYRRRASELISAKKAAEAQKMLEDAIAKGASWWRVWHELGLALLKQEKYEEALPAYREAIDRNRDTLSWPWSCDDMRTCFVRLSDQDPSWWQRGVDYFLGVVKQRPEVWAAWHMCAYLLYQGGRRREAKAAYIEAIIRNIDDAWAWSANDLCSLFMDEKEPELAYDFFTGLTEERPKMWGAWHALSMLERDYKNNVDAAIEALKKAIALHPDRYPGSQKAVGWSHSWLNLGHCYQKKGMLINAAEAYQQAHRIEKENMAARDAKIELGMKPWAELRMLMASKLDAQQLREVCFDIGLPLKLVAATEQREAAVELVAACRETEAVSFDKLVEVVRKLRPDLIAETG